MKRMSPTMESERAKPAQAQQPFLSVSGLNVSAVSKRGRLNLVKDVSFEIARGGVVGMVGESGSGKSLTASALLSLLPSERYHVSGTVTLEDRQLSGMSNAELRTVRGADIGLITQDALTGLDPVYTIGFQMVEAINAHRRMARPEARDIACGLLEEVGISDPASRLRQYPHELSGGMQQRVLLALALINEPKLLVADEPTTALDVTVQAQLVRLLARESANRAMSLLLITHDLRLVAGLCDQIIVMYAGRIVETGTAREVYVNPQHPYTRALLDCALDLSSSKDAGIRPIPGHAPNPSEIMTGCEFAPRCAHVFERCNDERPTLTAQGTGRIAACHLERL
jgi:oligopeptide/dipeptide ABC transporter ATP-binding protein